MIVLAFPDIHGRLEKLMKLSSEIANADLVLLLGDITNFGNKSDMRSMVDEVLAINQNCLAVPGNCDQQETEIVLNELGINLNGAHKIINGLAFVGLGASLATPSGGTPFEVTESYMSQKLEAAVVGLDDSHPMILVSHQPPYNTTADAVNPSLHVGSYKVRDFIENNQPMLCFTGHIHEGQGVDTIGKTKVINSGPVFQGNYAYAEISDSIDLLEIRSIA